MGAFDDLVPAAAKPSGAFDDLVPAPRAAAGAFNDLIPARDPGDTIWDKIKGAPLKLALGTGEGLQDVTANIGEGIAQVSDPGPLANSFGNFLRAQRSALMSVPQPKFDPVKNELKVADPFTRAMGTMELQREQQREAARRPGEALAAAAGENANEAAFAQEATPGPKVVGEAGKTAGETMAMMAPSALPIVGPVAGAATAGLASTGGSFDQAYQTYLKAGYSEEDAREKARTVAANTGGTTALLFALPVGRLAELPQSALGRLMLAAGIGGTQMGADTLQTLLKARATYEPDLTLADIAKQTGKTAAFGSLLSGVLHGAGEAGKAPESEQVSPNGEQPLGAGEQPQPVTPTPSHEPLPPAPLGARNRVAAAIQEMLQPSAQPGQTAKADQIGPISGAKVDENTTKSGQEATLSPGPASAEHPAIPALNKLAESVEELKAALGAPKKEGTQAGDVEVLPPEGSSQLKNANIPKPQVEELPSLATQAFNPGDRVGWGGDDDVGKVVEVRQDSLLVERDDGTRVVLQGRDQIPFTKSAEGETTGLAAPETQTGGTAPEVASTPGTPAEKAAPLADGGTIPVEGGESPSRSAAASRTGTSTRLSYTNNRPHDLIDEIEGQVGTIDPTLIKEANPNWKPTGAARKIFKKGGTPADVAADAMAQSGLYKGDAGQVDQFGDAVNGAAQARKGFRARAALENKQATQDAAFARDVSRPGVNQRTIIADDLQPGDELKIRGAPFKVREFEFDDDGRVVGVTMDDGAKYGTQEVKGGTEIKYDNRSLRKSDEPIVNRRTPEGTTKQRVAGEGQPGEPRSRDKTVEFLNSLKVDTKGQVHAFGLAPAVWNTLVDGVIMGVRGGRKIAEAVSWAIDRLKEKYPGVQFDEAGAREHFEKTPVGNLRYESPEGKEVAPADQMKARREEIDSRLGEISGEAAKAQKGFMNVAPELRSERFQLSKERRGITDKLLQDPAYVRELIVAEESKGAEYQAAKASGDTARAREIAEESLRTSGDKKTELERVAPELHDQVRQQLEKEGVVKPLPQGQKPGRSLGSLTDWLRSNKIDSPKLSLRERFSLARRVADTWSKGKSVGDKIFSEVMATWKASKEHFRRPPVDDDVRALRKDWLYEKQITGGELKQWLDEIDRTVERPERQMALSVYLDAGRDENLLRSQLDYVPEKWKKVWQAALNLSPSEKDLAARLALEFQTKLSDGQQVGIVDRGRADYGVPQLWDKKKMPKWDSPYDPEDPQFKRQGAPRNLRATLDTRDPFFALKRQVPSYFDGIMSGGEPVSLKVRDLVGIYNAQFNEAVTDRAYVWGLRKAKADDAEPVVYLSGGVKTEPAGEGGRQIFVDSTWRNKDAMTKDGRPYVSMDHPALKGWRFASVDADKNPIMVRGDFMVHPDKATEIARDLDQSIFRDPRYVGELGAKIFSGLIKSTAVMKASKFAAATFHGFTLAEHLITHAFAAMPTRDRLSLLNPLTNGVELDPAKNPNLAHLMRNGLMLGMDGQRELFQEGLASHGGLLEHVPVLGDALKAATDYVFGNYLPRLKAKLGDVLLDANRARYSAKFTDDQIGEITANEINAAFGGQNWRLLGHSKTLMDLNRIMFTAPDFLLSRAKVVGQAFKPYHREQQAFLVAQAALVYTGARVLNTLFSKDHNPHWEPGMWDKVVIGKRAYSARFLVSDIANAVTHPIEFAGGRIGPWPKTVIDALVQRDWRTGGKIDVPFKTDNKALRAAQIIAKDLGSWAIPVGAEGFLPGAAVKEQSKGSQVAQALAGAGSRKYTAETQMFDAAANFNRNAPDAKTKQFQQQRDEMVQTQSAYRKLTDLIDAGRLDDARKEYQDILAGGRTTAQVSAHFQGIFRPFSGSVKRERSFKASLSPQDLQVYNDAIQERKERRDKFNQIRVPAPVAEAGAD